MPKKIIVTGPTGQDGSYMIEYLLANTEDTVIAAMRRTSQAILSNCTSFLNNPRVKFVTVDLTDAEAVRGIIRDEKPDYFINFGAQSYVADSWKNPVAHMMTNAMSIIYILEAIREYVPHCRFYSAGSSEQWGDVKFSPQNEDHPMSPRSIYGVSKCAASHIVKVYRESYGLYAVHGVLLNHESERRQEYFFTRKITKGVARIFKHFQQNRPLNTFVEPFKPIEVGNLNSYRDWSHAEDFIEGIWRMLNQERYNPALKGRFEKDSTSCFGSENIYSALSKNLKEYVLSSNETHSLREFVELAFKAAGMIGEWRNPIGGDLNEKFVLVDIIDPLTFDGVTRAETPLVVVNVENMRKADVNLLHGDSTKARLELGWTPKISFKELVERMVRHDLEN